MGVRANNCEVEIKNNWTKDYKTEIDIYSNKIKEWSNKFKRDLSTELQYKLPEEATELQDLISFKNMNAQIGEIFRTCYKYELESHPEPKLRDIKKIIFYAQEELKRLENYE